MPKPSDSFILELALRVTPRDERRLEAMFFAARQVYNACLGESLKRLKLMRDSKLYQRALSAPRGAERNRLFKEAREAAGFREYDLHHYFNNRVRKAWIYDLASSPVGQKLATRAFQAANEYSFGKRGRPRFKGTNQLDSIEGKSNESAIRWRDGVVKVLDLELKAILDPKDKHGVQAWGLEQRVKYVRLVRRRVRSKTRYFAQLVLDGQPLVKAKHQQRLENAGKRVALDVGPSTVAVVGEAHAALLEFIPGLNDLQRERRILQRKLDRSRRATNPHNYREDGTITPGPKRWVRSRSYQKTRDQLAELERRLATHRRNQQQHLVNEVLQHGSNVMLEDVSVKTWQRMFGRSVRVKAPGLFVEKLARKAESAGGRVHLINTRTTALSQRCVCGNRAKKRLNERVHDCPNCGLVMQRDLLAAYLALHTDTTTLPHVLHADKARLAYQGAEPLLRAAWQHATQPANGQPRPSTFGTFRSQSGSPEQDPAPTAKAQHDVPHKGEGLGEARGIRVRTPGL